MLAQSPPAELPQLVTSLKLLTGDAALVDGVAPAAARQLAHDHLVALDMPGGAGKVSNPPFLEGGEQAGVSGLTPPLPPRRRSCVPRAGSALVARSACGR